MDVNGVFQTRKPNIAMENTNSMDILLVHYRFDPIAYLIRLYSKSFYNHCAWILNNHLIIESTRGGIQINSIHKYDNKFLYKTLFVKLPILTDYNKQQINNYLLNKIISINYLLRLFSFICIFFRLNRKLIAPTCSNIIASAFATIGICFNYKKDTTFITPEDIYQYYLKERIKNDQS
jgi:hypothetical protein